MPWEFLRVSETRRGRMAAAGLLSLSILALLAIAAKDPRTHGLGTLCPSLRLLGIYCPGCGSTRAMYDLMHGEPVRAIRNNPLLVFPGLLVLVVFIANLVYTAVSGRSLRLRTPGWFGYTVAALFVAYCILRNIPADCLECLRPPT